MKQTKMFLLKQEKWLNNIKYFRNVMTYLKKNNGSDNKNGLFQNRPN